MLRVLVFSFFGLVAATAALSGTPPQDQAPAASDPIAALPEGEGRDLTATLCTQCHAIGMVTSQQYTREEWEDVIVRMTDQGFYASEAETAQIVGYLSEHFSPEA